MRKRVTGGGDGVAVVRSEARSRHHTSGVGAPSQSHGLNDLIVFGEALLRTNDLDPVYVAVATLNGNQLRRLLLAYWCFYHLGLSAWLSEFTGEQFWLWAEAAARNDTAPSALGLPAARWPRGTERRHFRGKAATYVITALAAKEPENWVRAIEIAGPVENLIGEVLKWPGFGPWISFKAADMVERLLKVPVVFPNDCVLFYKEPRAALDLLPGDPVTSVNKLLTHFRGFRAPPGLDRPCNIQEVETVCCKWKSSLSRHYWVGKDIHEVRAGLKGWGATADLLLRNAPKEVERGLWS